MSGTRPSDQWLMSYKELRKAVGLIGMMLPIILIIGKILVERQLSVVGSISGYYYTAMGSVFVGGLWAIGVFLIFYRGPEPADNLAGYIAGISAIAVALLPTKPAPLTPAPYHDFPAWVGVAHLVFASIFFIALAYFCLVLFVKTKPGVVPTPKKRTRNRIYKICGYVIIASIIFIVLALFLEEATRQKYAVFLVLESVAVLAFGVAWWVKGEAVLKDN